MPSYALRLMQGFSYGIAVGVGFFLMLFILAIVANRVSGSNILPPDALGLLGLAFGLMLGLGAATREELNESRK